jgi:RecB family endonuclease NucS
LAQQENIMHMISKYIRFAEMKKEFVLDRVRTWLRREESDAIIGHLCLGRQSTAVCGYSRKGLTESKPLVDMADCVIGVWQF